MVWRRSACCSCTAPRRRLSSGASTASCLRTARCACQWLGGRRYRTRTALRSIECDGWIHALSRLLQHHAVYLFRVRCGMGWHGGYACRGDPHHCGRPLVRPHICCERLRNPMVEGYSLPSYIIGTVDYGTNEAEMVKVDTRTSARPLGDGGNEVVRHYHRVGDHNSPVSPSMMCVLCAGLHRADFAVAALSHVGFRGLAHQDAYIVVLHLHAMQMRGQMRLIRRLQTRTWRGVVWCL